MKLTLPELSLVVLVGVSGSGKSTFARKHFKATEILSSDYCRGLVSDDENSQAATTDAFDVLHFIARKRLAAGKLTVVDATNVQPEARNRSCNSRANSTACPWPSCSMSPSASRTRATSPALAGDYAAAYRRYCWPVNSVEDLKVEPFHLLATEGAVHADKSNEWHMQTLARLAGGIVLATPFQVIDVTLPESEAAATRWWEELTARGGEGMVVKPLDFIARNKRGLLQPAVKCRGREYLRIIYGPEYTAPENLERLRSRGLHAKRSLALREFALGLEALERFTRGEPLRRVHECVFGVLALESEPVDPRL